MALCVTTCLVAAPEDVTSQYLVNASFENDVTSSQNAVNNSADGLRGYTVSAPSGWTVDNGAGAVSLLINADCFTDNNFGQCERVADGEKAYYLRLGWSTGSTSLRQAVTLPKGNYKITAKVRSAYANSATSSYTLTGGSRTLSETFTQGSASCFASMAWKECAVTFAMEAAGEAQIGLDVTWASGGSCIMIDDVRLWKLGGEDVPKDPTEDVVNSPTEGVITADFVGESQMKDDLLQMLAKFTQWLKNDYQACSAANNVGELCGCFKGENTMGNNEQGVRPNADLSMICAFLVKYGKGHVTLPEGVTWTDIEEMAMRSLVFAYSTHKANKLKTCSGGNYWGSVSNADHVWESSLWAMSVAYSAFFQWDKLTETQRGYVYALLKAECNYELERSIPTGYAGDTKAEENGWEADILAATLGLFPNDALAPRWFARLREFAINSYSHASDAQNTTVIDPDYDTKTVADLFRGRNLYDDYTLQNHNLFHTSYQNVVMQELGEAALALRLFQLGVNGEEKWRTNALMHHNQEVQDEVLNWLALADGELAMPNGNDWSLFLYDQITSYTTQACFQRDANALMLENLAYKYIKARQTTTADGSWLLHADVGARRMGVEAHRVMMTWLMHKALSTTDLTPTDWDTFNTRYAAAKIFPSQNIVRAATADRFTCFSWSGGLKSYTGYIAANSVDKNKIIVPYRANNTGNFLGWYTVDGKATDATPVVSGVYDLRGNSYAMNGELNTNAATLNNRFALYSTPGNAVVYLDYVRANATATVTGERGGLMAISTDPLTKTKRTLHHANGKTQTDGSATTVLPTTWVNIDNALGVVSIGKDSKMAFGDRSLNNSIQTAKLYPLYSADRRAVRQGDVVGRRNVIYYSNVDAAVTVKMAAQTLSLTDSVPEGWNGILCPDPDGTVYALLSNFTSDRPCTLQNIRCEQGAPVFSTMTTITDSMAKATFMAEINHSVADAIHVFVRGTNLAAVQSETDSCAAHIQNLSGKSNTAHVIIIADGKSVSGDVSLNADASVLVTVEDGALHVTPVPFPSEAADDLTEGYTDITAASLTNPNFEDDSTYGNAKGNVTLGSVTYNPCYVNSVAATAASFPNVLPVKGWTAGNQLGTASKFARMYSMPYSTTLYCVSPSSVGNYAAQCARPMTDTQTGDRCLTVLNSWTSGSNAITQDVTLTAGTYRVLLDMRYECTNQRSNDGTTVQADGNTNTSLTGVTVGKKSQYAYPDQNATWQTMKFDFDIENTQAVTISLGYRSSAGVGAANNTLLYIDNVRLLRQNNGEADGIMSVTPIQNLRHDAYDLTGRKITAEALRPGIYIIDGKKLCVKN